MTAEAFVYDAVRTPRGKDGERFRPPAILLERAVPAGSLRAAVTA
ncbi:hypothetical protein [Blastococcus deserti]|uniref:Uncharacterized protein n=1 Tax=Blastococcus deserti TaxID=2259033 RepID=A0ABW4XF50_9ACTN